MGHLSWQYLVFVFIACCGVLQAAAAYSGLKGLLFVPRRWASFIVALLLVVGSFLWFFASESRVPPAGWPVLEGAQQTGLFALGAALSFAFTALAGSLLRWLGGRPPAAREEGLEGLRETGYLQAWLHRRQRG